MIREDVLREAEELAVINSVLELQWQRQVAPELAAEWVDFAFQHATDEPVNP